MAAMILRPFQREGVRALREGGHTVLVAPTGSGKSLIFQEYMRSSGCAAVILSPLVCLSAQHRRTLLESGVPESRFRILSPESLRGASVQRDLRELEPGLLVVDECHCYWEWGLRFRPAFRRIPALIGDLSISRSLWLTATLPPEARQEIRRALPSPPKEVGRFTLPPELRLEVIRVSRAYRFECLMEWLSRRQGPGLVFHVTREGCERLARLLTAAGIGCAAYHAGLAREERATIERGLRSGSLKAVVGTSALGMGIDIPTLDWVAIWQAPLTLLSLAQAIGRAARAGRRGAALVLWDESDFAMNAWANPSPDEMRAFLAKSVLPQSAPGAALEEYFNGVLPSAQAVLN